MRWWHSCGSRARERRSSPATSVDEIRAASVDEIRAALVVDSRASLVRKSVAPWGSPIYPRRRKAVIRAEAIRGSFLERGQPPPGSRGSGFGSVPRRTSASQAGCFGVAINSVGILSHFFTFALLQPTRRSFFLTGGRSFFLTGGRSFFLTGPPRVSTVTSRFFTVTSRFFTVTSRFFGVLSSSFRVPSGP